MPTTTTLNEGRSALAALRAWRDEQEEDPVNEAQTRFDIINRLVSECFGWSNQSHTRVSVERYERGEYTDYELGRPRRAILEAKREGVAFELPPGSVKKPIQDLQSVFAMCPAIKEAAEQCHGYCASRGVDLAIVTNGHQLVCFIATRNDGNSPFEGLCFVSCSLDNLDKNFATAWQLLSPEGVAEKRYLRILSAADEVNLPPKLSSFLNVFPKQRYPSQLQATLRTLSELLLQDIGETESEERQFFEQCYCSSGALSQHALLNRKILEARYDALSDLEARAPVSEPANPKVAADQLSSNVLQEALSRRPVILIGDVGVGKTSFLKNLIYNDAKTVFDDAVYIYANFGAKGALKESINEVVLTCAEEQILHRYGIDILEKSFIDGTYASEIARFKRGIYRDLFESDPAAARNRLLEMLEAHTRNRFEHLKRAITHIVKARHKQVIFILDNADQRSDDVQQEVFLVAQELAKDWHCHVFISLRPHTFYKSRQSGVLAAYPHRVFTIFPPRVDELLEKRLEYAIGMAEGKFPVDRLDDIQFHIPSMAALLKALLNSLRNNQDLQEMLANITGGNVRSILQFVTSFIGSPNVDAEKIVSLMNADGGQYTIPLHEFSKAALLGDYSHFHSESSLALNVFDVRHSSKEHFLVLAILAELEHVAAEASSDGFVGVDRIVGTMQGQGFTPGQVDFALQRCTNKRLIETPDRVLFEQIGQYAFDEIADKMRITSIGAFHLKRWFPTFAYLEAMSFDTPIFDESTRSDLTPSVERFDIKQRYERAVEFKKYLLAAWHGAEIALPSFNFEELLTRGAGTFLAVRRAIAKF